MHSNEPDGPSAATSAEAEEETLGLLEHALDRVDLLSPSRRRVRNHIEAAIKCLRDPREGIPPAELNATNDG